MLSTKLFAFSSLLVGALASSCSVTTVLSSPPSSGEIALQSYSYCGGSLNLTAYVENVSDNKTVTLYYTDRQDESTPMSYLVLNYTSDVTNSNWQYWNAYAPVWLEGITKLLNLTLLNLENNDTYHQTINKQVKASGAAAPTLPAPPKPYASPSGFSSDITEFLAPESGSEAGISHTRMFVNVNPPVQGAVKGVVVAARSGPTFPQKQPNYEYNWVRDSSLTMDVVQSFYAAASNSTAKSDYETILFEYAVARATEQTDPNLQTGLGEPKFYLNNTIFSGPWGRPQNDGAATSAVTLMEFATEYLANGGSLDTVKEKIYNSTAYPHAAPVMKDLLFVASNWSSPTFDIWEEEEGDQFYTRFVQRKALLMGTEFATKMGDSETASTLSAAEKELTPTLSQFWDPNREIILYEYGPVLHNKTSYLDTATILGIIHGYAGDGVLSYTNDYVLSTAVRIATCFIDVYPIANKTKVNSAGEPLSMPVGRYPEDTFNGTIAFPNGGNPWYLCTAAFSQFMYAASSEYNASKSISVTKYSKYFFDYFAPEAGLEAGKTYKSGSKQFEQVIGNLNGWGDAFMRTVMYYTPSNGHLHEEINRDTGVPQGAADLTWSYASVLTAAIARAEVIGDTSYTEGLANLGVQPNT